MSVTCRPSGFSRRISMMLLSKATRMHEARLNYRKDDQNAYHDIEKRQQTPPKIPYRVNAGMLTVALNCAQAPTISMLAEMTSGLIAAASDEEVGLIGSSREGNWRLFLAKLASILSTDSEMRSASWRKGDRESVDIVSRGAHKPFLFCLNSYTM